MQLTEWFVDSFTSKPELSTCLVTVELRHQMTLTTQTELALQDILTAKSNCTGKPV